MTLSWLIFDVQSPSDLMSYICRSTGESIQYHLEHLTAVDVCIAEKSLQMFHPYETTNDEWQTWHLQSLMFSLSMPMTQT